MTIYTNIDKLLNDIEVRELLTLVNDEGRPQLEIDIEDETDICAARINQSITSAEIEINGYLRARYSLPFDIVPERITKLTIDIAIYNLYKRRRRLDMPDSIISIYKSAIKELDQIRKGDIDLGIATKSGEPESSSAGVYVNKTDDDRIFDKDTLSKY